MRPKVLGDRLRGDWAVVGCEETTQNLFEGVKMCFSAPDIGKMYGNEVGSVNINLVWTVVPDTGDDRVVGVDKGVYDEAESENNNVRI